MSATPSFSHASSVHHKKRSRTGWYVLGGLLALFVFCLPLIVGGTVAALGLKDVYSSLQVVQAAALEQRVDDARVAMVRTDQALLQVQKGERYLLYWRYLPVVKSYTFTLRESVGAAQSTLQGVNDLLDVAELVQKAFAQVGVGTQSLQNPLTGNRTFRDLSSEEKRQILGRINTALPQIRAAQEQMRIALLRWQAVPKDGLAEPLRQELEAKIGQFQAIQAQFDEVVRLAEIFLPLSGYDTPKKYLVVLQNNQEMRGTGGFIGNVGEVWVDGGDVEKMVFQDVYSIDNPVSGVWKNPSPAPVARWLEQKNLFLRDANWIPDFPTTAQTLLAQYQQERALASITVPDLDGIIAFEPDFFRRLMVIIGPVQVEDQVFTAENFFDALQYDVHIKFSKEGIPVAQRKEVVAKLGDAVFQKVMNLPSRQWPLLLGVMTTSLAQKDVMLYMHDERVQKLIDARDWSGRVKTATGDYLWVVDSNLAAWKTDGVMDKQILYGLDASDPNDLRATVTLRYKNTNLVPDWRYIQYRNYARIYVPQGSQLISSTGAMDNDLIRNKGRFVPGQVDTYDELGKTVFGAFFAVEPGKTGELQFTYRLPASVAAQVRNGSYGLLVQKQPGSYARFVMDGRFPRTVNSATPTEDLERYGDARYQQALSLETDQHVSVSW